MKRRIRVVFLDIDGVLNSGNFRAQRSSRREPDSSDRPDMIYRLIDRAAVLLLERIIQATGAKVVLSSAWRDMIEIEKLHAVLRDYGFTGEIIGRTPTEAERDHAVFQRYENRLPDPYRYPRGYEIQQWLDRNHRRVESFAILDDEDDMVHLADRHVHTDFWPGLTEEDAAWAIDLLHQPLHRSRSKPLVPEVLPVVRRLLHRAPAGCCWHAVLVDRNFEPDAILWTCEYVADVVDAALHQRAHAVKMRRKGRPHETRKFRETHDECVALAGLLPLMSRTQLRKLAARGTT